MIIMVVGFCASAFADMPPACRGGALQGRWECYYQVEPLDGLSAEGAKYVLGGEACQWGEGVNEHNFDARTWSTAAAVAERLWSPRSKNPSAGDSKWPQGSFNLTQARLEEHVCR